jgi:hypothetical protein
MGPYLIEKLELLTTLPGTEAAIPPSDVGFGVQCVGLVKRYSGAGATGGWRAGDSVMSRKESGRIAKGTAIATFSKSGRYDSARHGNHACFFISFQPQGILVLEQHVPPNFGTIQTRTIRSRGADTKFSPSDNADAFSVIL